MTKAWLIAGGTSATAQALAPLALQAGLKVVVTGRDVDRLKVLYSGQSDIHCLHSEATDSAFVNNSFDQAEALGLDIVGYAHCVGSILVSPLLRTQDQQLEEVMRVNFTSAFYGLRRFVQHRKQAAGPGSAVLVSTCATGIGVPNHEAIAAAKGAIEGLARSAAASYAADNIRVNVVAPGLTDSPMAAAFLKSDVMRAASAKQYPLHGVNAPLDVAQAMAWLLSDQASRVTGTVLNVDGGFRNIRPLVK